MRQEERFIFGNGGVFLAASKKSGVVYMGHIDPELGYVGDIKEEDQERLQDLDGFSLQASDEDQYNLMIHLVNLLVRAKESFEFKIEYSNIDVILDFNSFNPDSVLALLDMLTEALMHTVSYNE